MTYQRYVALGDSQTEGLLDADGSGGYRGWADRFAEFVAAVDPALLYANLAVRGRRVHEIRTQQVGPALAMAPDLVTVMGGMNDLLRPDFDRDQVLADLDAVLGAFEHATVLTNTFPIPGAATPLLRRLGPRVAAFNAGIRELAARRGALLVDFAHHGVGTDLRIWSPDRIHANPVGHALIATAFADTLGLDGFAGWHEPLTPTARRRRIEQAASELHWTGTAVLPWVGRRVRGRSSGDGITAKRPQLVPVSSLFHLVDPAVWRTEEDSYRPASLEAEGFVHFSFAHQLAATANRHYRDTAELAAVELDPMRLGGEIRIEDSYGSGTQYPHLYGPVPVAAAVAVHPLSRTTTGDWTFTARGAVDAAWPDH